MSAWKALERVVAAVMGGVRSWDTDHDVLVVTRIYREGAVDGSESGSELLGLARKGQVELASIEVKNLTAPTIAQVERFLRLNRLKADRDGIRWSALVVKRKAGRGARTMALLVVPLEEFHEEG